MITVERVFNKAKNYDEALKWDILQQINMTPEQRQKVARELKRKFYGDNIPDIKGSRK